MIRLVLKVAAIGLLGCWFLVLRPVLLGGTASYIMVSGSSMEPTLYTGDLVIVRKQNEYSVGDTIAFRTSGGLVIHRIVGGNAQDGFVTQGDNKDHPDPWKPQPMNIAGKQFIHVPRAARLVLFMRRPVPFIVLIATLGTAAVTGTRKISSRRRGRRMVASSVSLSGRTTSVKAPLLAALAASSIFSLLMLSVTAYSFKQPEIAAASDDSQTFRKSAEFSWTAHSKASTIDPDGVIGPVTASSAAQGAVEPIFTSLAHDVVVDMTLRFAAPDAAEFEGTLRIDLIVSAPDSWSTTLELQPDTNFSGTSTSSSVTIDIAAVQSLIQKIHDETGVMTNQHSMKVVPSVSIEGATGGTPIHSDWAPEFSFVMNDSRITPDSEFVHSDEQLTTVRETHANSMRLIGIDLPVGISRILGTSGAVLGVAVTGLLAASVFLGFGRDESAKARARYGAVFIEASDISGPQPVTIIDVSSLLDLARLAQRDGRIVFHQNVDATTRRYFVPDGATMYQHLSKAQGSDG